MADLTIFYVADIHGSDVCFRKWLNAAAFYGAGYLAALQERARTEFPDVAFTLIVDCGDAAGWALACLRAGVKTISMEPLNDKIADIARQMGAELVRRPT